MTLDDAKAIAATQTSGNRALWRLLSRLRVDQRGCWSRRAVRQDGYLFVSVFGENKYAHRVAYEMLVGKIPPGLTIDHLCRNRACCNPSHLEPVTMRENMMRGEGVAAKHARQTHCKHGHPFSGHNLIIASDGERKCRECYRRWNSEYRRRKLGKAAS